MLKKINRNLAYKYLFDYAVNGRELDEDKARDLLQYFAPNAGAVAHTTWDWLRKAVAGTKDPRYYLQYIHIKGNVAYATNGHMLFWAPSDRTDGFYDPFTMQPASHVDGRYPDVERVIADHANQTATTHQFTYDKANIHPGRDAVMASMDVGDLLINDLYLRQAMNGNKTLPLRTTDSVLMGEHDLGSFIIMPMRK